jgi:hypothetical protein
MGPTGSMSAETGTAKQHTSAVEVMFLSIQICEAPSMASQIHYKVWVRIDVVSFWLQSKPKLDPLVEENLLWGN